MDKTKIDFAPGLSDCTLHFHCMMVILTHFSNTALGLLLQSCFKWKPRNWAKLMCVCGGGGGGTLTQGSVFHPSTLML